MDLTLSRLGQYRDWGITVLRIIVGVVFFVHGMQKIFMIGIPGVGGFFTQLGIPAPELMAIVVTAVETLGGLALIAGALTRWVAIPLAITMLVAIFTAHLSSGFFVNNGGYEFALTLLAGSVALVLAGSGAMAVDNILESKDSTTSFKSAQQSA
jgi:putative oxidoreductase